MTKSSLSWADIATGSKTQKEEPKLDGSIKEGSIVQANKLRYLVVGTCETDSGKDCYLVRALVQYNGHYYLVPDGRAGVENWSDIGDICCNRCILVEEQLGYKIEFISHKICDEDLEKIWYERSINWNFKKFDYVYEPNSYPIL